MLTKDLTREQSFKIGEEHPGHSRQAWPGSVLGTQGGDLYLLWKEAACVWQVGGAVLSLGCLGSGSVSSTHGSSAAWFQVTVCEDAKWEPMTY